LTSKVALIDYGMGNIHSVAKAIERVGGSVVCVHEPEELRHADRIVLPGVGAFRDCIRTLEQRGLAESIASLINDGIPYLGICLGMQLLLTRSLEFGRFSGLNLIPGEVIPFPADFPERGFKIPHMGWNDVDPVVHHPILAPLSGRQVYYVHSYYCHPENPGHILATCTYGDLRFAAAIGRDNILGVQFHPEKSQQAGLDMLSRFLRWQP